MVLFRLGSVLWAAPASVVREVISAGPATRIPGCHAAVAGLVNLRGTLLTVVDGRRAVGLADADSTSTAGSILVVEQGGRAYGLSVDEVVDLVDVPPDAFSSGPAPSGVDARFIRGFARQGARAFVVLNTEVLLAPVLG
jgi:purine-binding chemotaxis protein CheW